MESNWIDLKCSSPYVFTSEVFSLFWAVVVNTVQKSNNQPDHTYQQWAWDILERILLTFGLYSSLLIHGTSVSWSVASPPISL